MTTLITGSTGTTSSRLASLLHSSSPTQPILIATRKLPSSGRVPVPALTHPKSVAVFDAPAVRFEWTDASTYGNPFSAVPAIAPIKSIYLVAPNDVVEPASPMLAFIDYALNQGVQRFVLLSASVIPEGGPIFGLVHKHLHQLGNQGICEWAVLRPTWFQQNFESQALNRETIKHEGKFYTAAGRGKVPWIDAGDIAHVGFHALTSPSAPNCDYIITGPELLSYDDCAVILSKELGREVSHIHIDSTQRKERFMKFASMPDNYANMMTGLDQHIANGGEADLKGVVEETTGVKPRAFAEFVKENKEKWAM